MSAPEPKEQTRERREAVCAAMRRLEKQGLNQGTAGNVSVRIDDGFLVTPNGVPPRDLAPPDLVHLRMDGSSAREDLRPSSEWRFHRDIYASRADAGAIVHVHSPYATALACQRRPIPAFHYMVAVAGGNSIRCASYATFGTQALSDAAVAALEGRQACLLANHGLIAIGESLGRAMDLAVEVESLSRQYALSLAIGEPVLLSDAEMERVIEKFKTYGARRGRA